MGDYSEVVDHMEKLIGALERMRYLNTPGWDREQLEQALLALYPPVRAVAVCSDGASVIRLPF